MFRCSCLMCRSKSSSLKKKRSTAGQGVRKVVPFPPIPPSHRHGPNDSRNTIHFQKLTLREFALLPTRKNCFEHRTRFGSLHRKASIHACHPPHAPLIDLCVSKLGAFLTLFRPTSAMERFGRFFLSNLLTFFGCFWRRPFLCSRILLGSQLNRVRKNLRHTKKLPLISVQFAHKVVTLVRFFQRVDVISKSLRPWSGMDFQFPITLHARAFVHPCLP